MPVCMYVSNEKKNDNRQPKYNKAEQKIDKRIDKKQP